MRPFLSSLSLLACSTAALAQGWVPGPDLPDAPTPRIGAAALTFGGQVLAIGGTPLEQPKDEEAQVDGLTPGATSWVGHANLEGPMTRVGVGEDALGRLIVYRGVDAVDPEGDVGQVYAYDLVQGKQGTVGQPSGLAAEDQFAFAADDAKRLYLIGGVPQGGSVPTSRVERYHGPTDSWSVLAPLPTPVFGAAAVNDGQGHVLVLGGRTGSSTYTANVARYDVATGTWSDTAIPDLPVATAHLAAAVGADGRVYAIGGRDAAGYLDETWVLDASHTAWTAGDDLSSPRAFLAATLGPDSQIYAIGGQEASGGFAGCEVLYTPSCPEFPTTVAGTVGVWPGLPAVLAVEVFGGTPLTLRWQKDGVDLVDGPAAGGGTVSGATTDSLRIDGFAAADEGAYTLVATNGCGSATSPVQTLELRQAASRDGLWSFESLHPAGALSSSASGADGLEVVGEAAYPDATYGSLGHPMRWPADGGPALDLTPANSVGGGILVSENGTQAGWYWWPYTTPLGTGYHKHACVWNDTAASHVDVQPSGWEYGSINDTDGSHHVGNVTINDFQTHGVGAYWASSVKSAVKLTPAGDWGCSVNAIHDGEQFGSVIHPFAVVRAAKWSGSSASYEDMTPSGYGWSYISGADDGAQVGRAQIAGEHHAILWGGSAAAFADLHPTGSTSSEALDVEAGLQLGRTGNTTALWAGVADDWVDLTAKVPAGFGGFYARDLEVLPDGDVVVVGYATDLALGHGVAVRMRMRAATLEADVQQLSLSAGGSQGLTFDLGPDFAGHLHLLLGSATGTSPGLPVDGVVLPLALDSYLLLTLGQPAGLFQGTFGFLDGQGTASASLNVPAGADPGLAGLVLHHAGLVLDLAGTGLASWATNAVPLELLP